MRWFFNLYLTCDTFQHVENEPNQSRKEVEVDLNITFGNSGQRNFY